MDKFDEVITPHYPIYTRAPNKLIRYEERAFELPINRAGIIYKGFERIAIFKDSKGKEHEAVAQVIWSNL